MSKLFNLFKFILFLFLIVSRISYSSTNEIEVLNKKLLKVSGDEKIEVLNNLAIQYTPFDIPKSMELCKQALELGKLSTNNIQIASSYNIIGNLLFDSGKYKESLTQYLKSFEIRSKLKNKDKIEDSLNNIAIVYEELGDYTNALESYLESLLIYEEKNDANGRASSLVNLGGFYDKLGLPYKALNYLTNSLELFYKTDEKAGTAVALGNISSVYNSLNEYQKALDYQFDSLKIEEELNNKLGIAISYNIIAEIYGEMTNHNKSLEYYNKSLKISNSIKNESILSTALCGIGSSYSGLGNQTKALEFQQLALSNSLKSESLESIYNCYEELSKTYCRIGKHNKAVEMFKSYSKLKDKLFSQSLAKKMVMSNGKYDDEKKRQKTELLQNKNQIQELRIQNFNALISAAFILIVILSVTVIMMKKNIKIRKIIENALRESEDRYRTIFECSPLGIGHFDKNTVIASVNDKYLDIIGSTKDKVIGFNMLESLEDEKVRQTLKLAMGGKVSVYEGEYLSVTGNKKTPVRVTYNRITNQVCEVTGGVCIVEDITERRKVEAEKKKLEDQLARSHKMETIGLLAGGVAHDLNNVLCAVVSYPELLLMELPEDSPLRKPINKIKQAGENAAAIVQDMLTLARRGVNTMKILNINDIITCCLNSPECEKLKSIHSNINLEAELQTNIENIEGSEVHLKKAIINLLINAAEAQPHGGKITISSESRYIDKPIKGYENILEGDYIVIKITDNGIGISEEDLERIFEPFYTKKIMGRSGTGLGMSVVWGAVQDHNGYIDVTSSEGYGTTFELYFPTSRESIPNEKQPPILDDYISDGETILVIDDIKEQREIAKKILEKLGYSVSTVASGEEAVEYFKQHTPDIIVLDMIMEPGINGLETYKQILEICPKQKAIIASGFSETEHVKATLEIGAGIYIKKPYTMQNIGLAIKKELNS